MDYKPELPDLKGKIIIDMKYKGCAVIMYFSDGTRLCINSCYSLVNYYPILELYE
jgi:hypothetical protein